MVFPNSHLNPVFPGVRFDKTGNHMTLSTAVCVGIDVSKGQLEVAIGQSLVGSFDNTSAGITRLRSRLPREVSLVVIEATGCYSALAARELTAAGYRVAVVQPGRVRQYARSQGLLAKTDGIDARIIAQYGEHSPGLRTYQEPPAVRQRLRALVDRRDQVVEDRVREENRLEACTDDLVRKSLRASVARLRRQAATLERQIKQVIAADHDLTTQADILTSQRGVGSLTAAHLMAHLPELGHVNRQEIAALAGVAPYNRDSGQYRGSRSIFGGRQRVRTAMHMAAITAMRSDHAMTSVYQRLIERGKPVKVAIVAIIRKMLMKLNTLVAAHRQQHAHPIAT